MLSVCMYLVQGSQVPVATEQPVQTSESPVSSPPPTKKHHPPHALKPVHIREAMRRLEQTHTTAPVATIWV